MNDVEYILDFVVNLGNRMLGAGANLERVNDTMTRVCLSYHLEFISMKLIVFSFTASLGFGIVFRIGKKNLLWAGVGGALTRCVYLFLLEVIDQRILYSLLAAMFAALYAEIMAMRQKMPSTVFLYPAIIPLIPRDLLYNTAVNLILQNTSEMLRNAQNCALSLAGMSIGFVLISTFTYYRRIYYVGTDIAHHLLRRRKKDSVD